MRTSHWSSNDTLSRSVAAGASWPAPRTSTSVTLKSFNGNRLPSMVIASSAGGADPATCNRKSPASRPVCEATRSFTSCTLATLLAATHTGGPRSPMMTVTSMLRLPNHKSQMRFWLSVAWTFSISGGRDGAQAAPFCAEAAGRGTRVPDIGWEQRRGLHICSEAASAARISGLPWPGGAESSGNGRRPWLTSMQKQISLQYMRPLYWCTEGKPLNSRWQ
mmetsp:Transcript_65390/g.200238  ORF Transcript_65390/g.200238 Transcript_65390/m.200238 type:complete len:220 (-) Transcript_65390:237-896(-)